MSVSVIRQRIWKIPSFFSGKSLAEDDHARMSMSGRVRLLLRFGIGLLIVVWLVLVGWVVPVV